MRKTSWQYFAFLTALSLAAQGQSNWDDASWIACTRPMNLPFLAPAGQMGDWITATAQKPIKGYLGAIDLPNTPIVRAMAYWGSQSRVKCAVVANGKDSFFEKLVRKPRGYMDLAFDLKPGANTIEIRFAKPTKAVPACFGMRIRFADGSTREFRSSGSWKAIEKSGVKTPIKVIARYGANGFKPVVAFSTKRLAPVWFRRGFEVKPALKKAMLYHTGVGYANAWVNGKPVSDRVLSPPQTDYQAFTMFETDDVTQLLKEGRNALAIELASGWYHQVGGFGAIMSYGRPRCRACLKLEYADGSRQTVVSDPTWEWKEGAWREANCYVGEVVDYRLDHREWATPGKGQGWKKAVKIDPPGKLLVPRDFEPMRRIREIAPRSIKQVGKETWLLDFGENIAGWIRIPVIAPVGKEVFIRYSEMAQNGVIWNTPQSHWWCHGEPQRDIVIAGKMPTVYESRFAYKGFRWAEVSGLSQAPDPAKVRAIVVNTDVATKARFTSSNPLLNRLWAMGLRTHYANMHSILEDCPHREKCQWGGDLHSSWSMGFHALDSAKFYRHQVRLFYTPPLTRDGVPGSIGVGKRLTRNLSDFSWGVSPLFLSWRLWTHYGDLEMAKTYHASMRHYLAWFDKKSPNGFPHLHRHADHAAPVDDVPRTPQDKKLISAINFFAAAERFEQLSRKLGKTDDAKWAAALAAKIRKAILTRYKSHTFGNGAQDSLALAMGVFRDNPTEQAALAKSLVGYYRKNGHKFDGGFMSYWIYPMLSRYGYTDDAYRMLINANYPGPAWSVNKYDATTFWECFYSDPIKQFERSLNHHATNHPAAWLLTDLAGIRIDMDNPGGRHILLAPTFPNGLDAVEAAMKTVVGADIVSRWKRVDGKIQWTVTAPKNVSVRVHILDWQQQGGNKLPQKLAAGTHQFTLVKP